MRCDDDTTRDDITEALTHANHDAKRLPRVVGVPALPTPWDLKHGLLDYLLTELEARA